jgi:hypothetical protein
MYAHTYIMYIVVTQMRSHANAHVALHAALHVLVALEDRMSIQTYRGAPWGARGESGARPRFTCHGRAACGKQKGLHGKRCYFTRCLTRRRVCSPHFHSNLQGRVATESRA